MPSSIPVIVHETQWPAALAAQLRESLRTRRINPKFHYHSPGQVRAWLRLHEICSPARRVADFQSTYAHAFDFAVERLGQCAVHVIGLGCGGGQKEAALLNRLTIGDRPVVFSATDVSSDMIVTALQAAAKHLTPDRCSGLVCDLTEASDLEEFFDPRTPPGARRVVSCFGLIPNFETKVLQTLLHRILRPGDLLLGSANLAPGADYRRGVEQVLSQYDNALTRDWLQMLLKELGIEPDAGEIRFHIEEAPARSGLLRIAATYEFLRAAKATVEGKVFRFEPGASLRLFFSYRHTLNTLEQLLAGASLDLLDSWISESGEEGVFAGRLHDENFPHPNHEPLEKFVATPGVQDRVIR